MTLEKTILANFAFNEEYGRKVQPFLKKEYFTDKTEQTIYEVIDGFVTKYNAFPSTEAIIIDIESKEFSEEQFKEANEIIQSLKTENTKMEWLLDKTEKWCRDRAMYNAAVTTVQIMEGKNKKLSEGAIPSLFEEALAVTFDTHVGHDYLEDFESAYDFYHRIEERVPFDIDLLNKITDGGLPRKTLNVIIAGIGVGKTLVMCHMSAANLLLGKNVLYVTMEMAEERIRQRIDANLMDIDINLIKQMPKAIYFKKAEELRKKTAGRLIIKEFPTAQASSAHVRHLIHELNIKKNFKPDIIYVDYLNLMLSARVKYGQAVNSYTLVKSIAEELRGLGVENNVPIVSATQFNREGFDSTDPGMTNTAESFGLPATADLYLGIISTEEMDQLQQKVIKQLKNRYMDISIYNKFVIGMDKSKMRLYNVDDSGQEGIHVPEKHHGKINLIPDEQSLGFDSKRFAEFK